MFWGCPPDGYPLRGFGESSTIGGAATGTAQLDALERGRAFAVLLDWNVTWIGGADARAWLHDLITADVAGLPDRRSRRSLLLTPTGRIRADFHVAPVDGSFLLLQPPEQPERVDAILRPYVLSSDVRIEDRTDRFVLVAVLGEHVAQDPDVVALAPSVVGPGLDLLVPREASEPLLGRLRTSASVEVAPSDLEAWRIRRGTPRMGADFGPDALPAEAGLEDTIDFTKGCFLGQESVARVRNLGHPPRVLLHVRSHAPIVPGASVVSGDVVVGEVTSAGSVLHGGDAIVRVRWDADKDRLATGVGPLVLQKAK
jgi:folate-binding protein YgfZ